MRGEWGPALNPRPHAPFRAHEATSRKPRCTGRSSRVHACRSRIGFVEGEEGTHPGPRVLRQGRSKGKYAKALPLQPRYRGAHSQGPDEKGDPTRLVAMARAAFPVACSVPTTTVRASYLLHAQFPGFQELRPVEVLLPVVVEPMGSGQLSLSNHSHNGASAHIHLHTHVGHRHPLAFVFHVYFSFDEVQRVWTVAF